MYICDVADIENVTSIATGENHTLALQAEGTIVGWGENKNGQLGISPETQRSFVPILILNDEAICKVFAGWSHSAALTKNGEVYTWGSNKYGQLGGQRADTTKPEIVAGLKDVEKLSLGSEHNLALCKGGKLFSWGWNEHGNCGTGDTKDVLKPTQLFAKGTVRYAAAGAGYGFAVVE